MGSEATNPSQRQSEAVRWRGRTWCIVCDAAELFSEEVAGGGVRGSSRCGGGDDE